jgi:hypothetical protein
VDLEDEVRESRSLVQKLREENGGLTRLLGHAAWGAHSHQAPVSPGPVV